MQTNELQRKEHMNAGKRRSLWGLTELVVALRWAASVPFSPGHGRYFRLPTSARWWPVECWRFTPSSGQFGLCGSAFRLRGARCAAERPSLLEVCVEVGLCLVVVLLTGSVTSPFLLSLGAAVFIAGLRIAPPVVALATVGSIVGLGVAGLLGGLDRSVASQAIERAALLGASACSLPTATGCYAWGCEKTPASSSDCARWPRSTTSCSNCTPEQLRCPPR